MRTFFTRAAALVLAGCLSGGLVAGCSREVAPDRVGLWAAEADWVLWPEGWAKGVLLVGSRTLPGNGRVDRFRAVALPKSGPATVRLVSDGGTQSASIDGPTPIDFELPGGEARLESAEGVYLLRPRLIDATRKGRRIVFVMADTLRFDHATEALMPEVYRAFEGGTRFQQAYSPAAWTLPSVASIFTGQLPARLRAPDGTLISLPEGVPTLASELASQGFTGVAVTANYTVHHENRYSTGFDLFLVPDPKAGRFADAEWLNSLALEANGWLSDEDLFLYVQYMDVHDPYLDPVTGEGLRPPEQDHEPTEGEVAALRRAYASEAATLSRAVAHLLTQVGDPELVVFTADHGEEFHEHGAFRHGLTLFEPAVHVPLWIRGLGIESRTVEQPVSLVGLKDFLVERTDPSLMTLASVSTPVTAETFSFGPPRWSLITDEHRVIFAAQQLEPSSDPHRNERWLREHHPPVVFSHLDGRLVEPDRELVDRSVRALVDQFKGFRRGVYVWLREGETGSVEVSRVGRDGWIWGNAEGLSVRDGAEGQLVVDVDSVSPFALLFLPVEAGAVPEVTSNEGVTSWFDEGPPDRVIEEVEETLERLRALSYI